MLKSPISILQEYVMQHRLPLPSYEISGAGLSHQPTFDCIAKIGNHTVTGTGLTKKEAKHNAATLLLEVFNIKLSGTNQVPSMCLLPSTKSKLNSGPLINFIGQLNEFCSGNKIPHPVYTDGYIFGDQQFKIICTLHNFTEEGIGSTKKEAKQDAAKKMLYLLKDQNLNHMFDAASKEVVYAEPSNVDDAIEKYGLIINNISLSKKGNNESGKDDQDFVVTPITLSTWEELVDLCNNKGWTYQVTSFQHTPLMLKLKINDYTLLNSGDSRHEIKGKFVLNVVQMLKEGIDFGVPLIKD